MSLSKLASLSWNVIFFLVAYLLSITPGFSVFDPPLHIFPLHSICVLFPCLLPPVSAVFSQPQYCILLYYYINSRRSDFLLKRKCCQEDNNVPQNNPFNCGSCWFLETRGKQASSLLIACGSISQIAGLFVE